MDIHVKCNWHRRELVSWNMLPSNEIRKEFSYVVEEHMKAFASCDNIDSEFRFFNYRGEWYDYYEFAIAPDSIKSLGFDGIQTESYFSAIVVCYFDKDGYELDNEIVVGYAHW